MIILRASITSHYTDPLFRKISDQLTKGKYCQLSDSVYRIEWRDGGKTRTYVRADFVDECFYVHGWLYLGKHKFEKNAWEVQQAYVYKKCRGKGVAFSLYEMALYDDFTLISGSQQTLHGQSVWKKIVQDSRYDTWVQDLKRRQHTADVEYDQDTDSLKCDLALYEEGFCTLSALGERDTRLITKRI